ncbi:MAG: CAP domain-containing protein [Firmicutes bacterium]|nr:CAP domain-containing protein [Bacillota bacterium]
MGKSIFAPRFRAVTPATTGKTSKTGLMRKLSRRTKQAVAISAAAVMSVAAMPAVQVSAADVPTENNAVREDFAVSERVPAWVLPEQRPITHNPNPEIAAFEKAVAEAINLRRASTEPGPPWLEMMRGEPLLWDDDLATIAQWRASKGTDGEGPYGWLDANTQTYTITTNPRPLRAHHIYLGELTPEVVAERFFSGPMPGLQTIPTRTGSSGVRPSRIGVGYDVDAGFITIMFASTISYDVFGTGAENFIERLNVGSPWLVDSPYFFAFYEEHNPFFLPYMLAYGRYNGMTDEEILDWIVAEHLQEFQETMEQGIFEYTNRVRREHGLPPVRWDDSLGRSARITAGTPGMRNHIGPDGSTATDRARRTGWTGGHVMENYAGGFDQHPAITVSRWMNSDGHRRNILTPGHTHLGVGWEIRLHEDFLLSVENLHWSAEAQGGNHLPIVSAIQQFSRR